MSDTPTPPEKVNPVLYLILALMIVAALLQVAALVSQGGVVMPYAVNVADLTKYKDHPVLRMTLLPQLTKNTAHCEPGRLDGDGTLFSTPDEQAGALIAVIRLKIKRHELRCYYSKTGKGGWERV